MSSYFDYYQNFIQTTNVANWNEAEGAADAVSREGKLNTSVSSANVTAIAATTDNSVESTKMEHSYMRDPIRSDITNGLPTARTVLMRHAPQCASCFTHPLDEQELLDSNHNATPTYDEISAKEAMNECARIAKYVKNTNADDEDWEAHVNQIGWINSQKNLFTRVAHILDYDQLARLAHDSRPHEAMQRRAIIDKSASRMRRALAAIAWDPRLTQWLHSLLMDHLPPTYMASYLDIMQTLKTKLPTLTDKMLFSRPLNVSQELLAPVMKKQWEPTMNVKLRQLPHNVVIVTVPTLPTSDPLPARLQKWHKHLTSICQVVQISLPNSNDRIARQSLDQVAEIIVSMTRVKIHDLRTENSSRSIILLGFNAGAALALQVAMSETVACVICMGFAYNTMNGVRGNPDDRMLDIKVPILFVIGQNSQRTSQEEIEMLRERMQSESSLVVVGSADDALRVPKSRRKLENVTQAMVDSMIADEIYDYINKTLTNPPGPRAPSLTLGASSNKTGKTVLADGTVVKTTQQRKRKQEGNNGDATPAKTKYVTQKPRAPRAPRESKVTKPRAPKVIDPFAAKRKVGRPRTRPVVIAAGGGGGANVVGVKSPQMKAGQQVAAAAAGGDDVNMAIQSVLETESDVTTATAAAPVANNTMANVKSGPITINPMQKPTFFTTGTSSAISAAAAAKATTLTGAKIKMIPSNQFLQLKTLQSQSKIYTIKTGGAGPGQQNQTGTTIGSIVKTLPTATGSSQQQIFTLKSPNGQTTQFVTAAPSSAQQKYTVIKNANGTTTLQLAKNVNTATATSSVVTAAAASSNAGGGGGTGGQNAPGVDMSNIIDMPIMFADSDGNLVDSQHNNDGTNKQLPTITKSATTSNVGKLIISHKIIKEANPTTATSASNVSNMGGVMKPSNTIVINKPTTISNILPQGHLNASSGTTNKFVYLNRSTMKPISGNIITRPGVVVGAVGGGGAPTQQQYTKFIVTNPKVTSAGGNSDHHTPIVTNVKTLNLQALKTTTIAGTGNINANATVMRQANGIINVAGGKTIPQIQVINSNAAGMTTSGDKPQIRNIVLKPGGLRQIPAHLNTQLINRNLTVRKLNILPTTKQFSTIAGTVGGGGVVGGAVGASEVSLPDATHNATTTVSTSSTVQSSPKMITINTLNASPAATPPPAPASSTQPNAE